MTIPPEVANELRRMQRAISELERQFEQEQTEQALMLAQIRTDIEELRRELLPLWQRKPVPARAPRTPVRR